MPELADLNDATTRIEDSFEFPDNSYRDDYAKIAWFLTDLAAFRTELEEVSSLLWRTYSKLPPSIANKFFQTLRLVAKDQGFYFDSNRQAVTDLVTLFAAIPGEDYLGWIAKGVFFKDCMDLKHGEHSHSFQWLAIAIWGQKGNLTNDPAELYKSIYTMRPNGSDIIVPGFKLKPKASAQAARGDVSLWSWLVDCFPVEMADGQAIPAGESLFSDTFRCPQYVTRYLIEEADEEAHFLACYLKSRYRAHNWFKRDYVDLTRRRGATKIYEDYDHITGGATSKNLAYKKDESDLWMPIGADERNPGGYVRAAVIENDRGGMSPVGILTDEEIEHKKMRREDKSFHGHDGKMIVNY